MEAVVIKAKNKRRISTSLARVQNFTGRFMLYECDLRKTNVVTVVV